MSEDTKAEQTYKKIKEILSDQQGEIEVPVFWQMELKPSSNEEENLYPVKFPDFCYLTLTNASLPEITTPGGQPCTDPVRIFAHVGSIEPEFTVTKTLICTLTPGKVEHQLLNILFSPIDSVKLEVKGNLPVHIIGIISPFADDEFEYGEEEEEEEAKEEEPKEEK